MRPLGVAILLLAVAAGPAAAHNAADAGPLKGWTLDPWILTPLALSAVLLGLGWTRLRTRSSRGAQQLTRRAGLFSAGWITLALALISPLHQAGERSFAAHMLEHELLMLAAAPLLVLSEPLALMLWALPRGGRRALAAVTKGPVVGMPWRVLTAPVTATLLQAAALWLWHAPALFERALERASWHVAQHLTFLMTALLFWSAMLHRSAGRAADPARRLLAVLCLFATAVVSGALGALMAFSQSPWYGDYAKLGMTPFGLSPAEDQQAAGLLMWIPGGVVHAIAALLIVSALLRQSRGSETADAL
jgi:putative membrane protein